jgi:ketosteroid isomerase-like protein
MGQARDVVEKFYELFAADRIGDATDLFEPGCITLMPTGPLTQPEHEAMARAFRDAFSDSHMVVDHCVETGNDLVVLGHFVGTHTGALQSPGGTLPATGKGLNLRFIDYFRVESGRIVDHQTIFDQIELLAQLDALPHA